VEDLCLGRVHSRAAASGKDESVRSHVQSITITPVNCTGIPRLANNPFSSRSGTDLGWGCGGIMRILNP
jgi:hypothetical protein